ncbi:hypothetical protein HPB52_002790 [Rhipicephalus sanguineus]|uniref:Uncharacterized protein n=1 Tax=Rhipicephalus sanguineus TaxID=34632 RepID=A0A9D4T3N5_RHISA|nr:hypothetical protein HPB52_002790 [Rhipicephalus sanguineus]
MGTTSVPTSYRRRHLQTLCLLSHHLQTLCLSTSQMSSKQQILWSLQELLLSQNSHKVSPTTELGYHKQSLRREEALFHCEEVVEQDAL